MRMADINLSQFLTKGQVRVIMSDEKEEPIAVTAQLVKSNISPILSNVFVSHIIMGYKCSGLNHFPRDCQYQCGVAPNRPHL